MSVGLETPFPHPHPPQAVRDALFGSTTLAGWGGWKLWIAGEI